MILLQIKEEWVRSTPESLWLCIEGKTVGVDAVTSSSWACIAQPNKQKKNSPDGKFQPCLHASSCDPKPITRCPCVPFRHLSNGGETGFLTFREVVRRVHWLMFLPQVFCAGSLLKVTLLESSNLNTFEILFIKRALGNDVLMSTLRCLHC